MLSGGAAAAGQEESVLRRHAISHTCPGCSAFPGKSQTYFAVQVPLYDAQFIQVLGGSWEFSISAKTGLIQTGGLLQDQMRRAAQSVVPYTTPGLGSTGRCELPALGNLQHFFLKAKPCDPFTPGQNF